jgi:hypothetical protein
LKKIIVALALSLAILLITPVAGIAVSQAVSTVGVETTIVVPIAIGASVVALVVTPAISLINFGLGPGPPEFCVQLITLARTHTRKFHTAINQAIKSIYHKRLELFSPALFFLEKNMVK